MLFSRGHAAGGAVGLRYKPEGRGFDSRWCRDFSLTYSFRPHYDPGVDSASNRNVYQEYFLGVKASGLSGWQPCHHHVLKSGSLKLLEPSGPVQACNGIALPFNVSQYGRKGVCLRSAIWYRDTVSAVAITVLMMATCRSKRLCQRCVYKRTENCNAFHLQCFNQIRNI